MQSTTGRWNSGTLCNDHVYGDNHYERYLHTGYVQRAMSGCFFWFICDIWKKKNEISCMDQSFGCFFVRPLFVSGTLWIKNTSLAGCFTYRKMERTGLVSVIFHLGRISDIYAMCCTGTAPPASRELHLSSTFSFFNFLVNRKIKQNQKGPMIVSEWKQL